MYYQLHAIGLEDEGTAMFEMSRNTRQKKTASHPKGFPCTHRCMSPCCNATVVIFKAHFQILFLWIAYVTSSDINRTRQPVYYNVTLRLVVAVEKQ